MASQPTEGFIYCAVCKTKSPKNSPRCINCGFPFSGEAKSQVSGDLKALPPPRYELLMQDSTILPGRPGCITLYILALLGVGIALAIILITPSLSRSLNNVLGGALPSAVYPVLIVTGVVLLVSLIGLFLMRNWARWVQIGLLALLLLAQIPLFIWGWNNPRQITAWNLLGLVLGSSFVLFISLRWFWANRMRFS